MRRLIASLTAFAAAATLGMALATPAAAETIVGTPCEAIDYILADGTTVVFTFGEGCPLPGYDIRGGDPTVVVTSDAVGVQRLLWHQAVARQSANAACEEGWNGSWAQWPNDGRGGWTCERVVDWGSFGGTGGTSGTITITINGPDDWVNFSDVWDQYVEGCNVPSEGTYPDTVDNCL